MAGKGKTLLKVQAKGSIVSSVAKYEVQLTQMSLSIQGAFCWSLRQIHVTSMNSLQNCGNSLVAVSVVPLKG